jgi:hypothetical protein
LVNFYSLEPWAGPRLYYFLKFSEELTTLGPLSLVKTSAQASCPTQLSQATLSVLSSGSQEALISTKQEWLALRKDALAPFESIELQLNDRSSQTACTVRIEASQISKHLSETLPVIVFSESKHLFSGHQFSVKENFLVASLRYRVEASTRLSQFSVDGDSTLAPVIGALGSVWTNRAGQLGADLHIQHSMQSFPKNVYFSEWAVLLTSRLNGNLKNSGFEFRPSLGIKQRLLLSENGFELPEEARSISLLVAGATFDVEFWDRWMARAGVQYGLKELQKLQASQKDWKFWSANISLGYRLRPELRLTFESGLKNYSRSSLSLRELDFLGCGVELDF